MNREKLLTFLTALSWAMTAWATDYNVGTDADLRAAITNDGANITVTADIELSNSTLSIESNRTVTINLGGHTLDRKLTKRGEGGGQVITVRSGATLNLSNGTLKGGWGGDGGGLVNEGGTVTLTDVNITGNTADDRGGGISNHGTLTMTRGSITGNKTNDQTDPKGGGGIMNSKGASAMLTNVTITGNTVGTYGGGGICNFGTLTLDGGTITGNTVGTHGGGIWQEGTLSMQGTIRVEDNLRSDGVADNLYLYSDKVITVIGALTGSTIGVTMQKAGTFTSGYNTHNAGVDPTTIFTADMTGLMAVSLDAGNEAQLANALPEGDIYYVERSWDDVGKCVKAEIKKLREGDYIVLTGSDDDLIISQGTFVVKGDVSYDHIYTVDGGEHNIILCDGAKLSADFLRVEDDNEVYIYGQVNNTGQLVITEEALAHHAGIGSDDSKTVGTIVIHGGDINTKASNSSAGIGGGRYSPGGTVIIYGGKVYAEGNASVTGTSTDSNTAGSGIGGGFAGNGGDLTVYGGYVEAKGSRNYGGAGIGSGRRSGVEDKPNVYGGNVTIYGGTVLAHGSVDGGAGIGGGTDGNGATVAIHGGTVKAWGRGNGAGIGTGHNSGYNWAYIDFMGKLTVTGGEVYAYGHDDEVIGGAGIGGGRDANGSEVIITGGYVYAEGGRYSAGIGSGCEALFSGGVQGGSLTVTGGRVEAYGGEDAAGIGGGEDADGGTIKISGGYVYAKGSYGGAGIGGGEGGDGGNVTITGGTVHASAGSGDTGNRAIGPGYGSDAYGKLTIGDSVMVYSERKAAAVERHDMCWYRTDVHVEQCTHPDHTYTVSGTGLDDKHTEQCTYCTTPFEPEQHTFENNVCTVCGVTLTDETHTVSYYLPNNGEYGEPTEYKYIKGETITLPTAPDNIVSVNLTFAGWHVGTPVENESIVKQPSESLVAAGTDYTVDDDVSFAARYDYIHITLANETHNGEILSRYNCKQAQDVTLKDRTLYRDGHWNTLCLPFDVTSFTGTPLEGATVKTLESTAFDSATGTLTLNFTENSLTTLEAGKPYIVKWETSQENITDPVFDGVTINTALNPVATTAAEGITITFAGAYSPMFIGMERKNLLYMGNDNKLYYPSEAMTIGSCRGHFRLEGIEAGDLPSGVREFKMNFDGDPTGIVDVRSQMSDGRSQMSDEYYDLQGRKLSGKPTQKGIYIHNGVVVIK